VLDEPTAGVDRETTKSVLAFIARINEEQKITILLVTHDFAAVRRHAQHAIWLHKGKLFHGATSELLTADRMAEIFETGIG
jgi:D-methionine transport system ATP-binding protein